MYGEKPKDRIILHCDCNNFFASVEETLRPELREVPMAVAGDPESRHGIIVAKNQKAKAFGVQTAETIWQAKKKCPDLVCVPSHHRLYHEFYEKINAIYLEYTDLVEPFSVDESYLDVTNSIHLFKMTPKELADHLRARIKEELDITISVGVSFCKVFAKLGSDYKKPNATTVIMREDVERIVYPLPVSSLIFVGKRSVEVLEQYHIRTCGDLVQYDQQTLHRILGKSGDTLYEYIHGLENSRMHSWYEKHEPKSIGNSMTFRHDLVGEAELKAGISALCDSVAGRLRHAGKKCRTVQVGIRNPEDGPGRHPQPGLRHHPAPDHPRRPDDAQSRPRPHLDAAATRQLEHERPGPPSLGHRLRTGERRRRNPGPIVFVRGRGEGPGTSQRPRQTGKD